MFYPQHCPPRGRRCPIPWSLSPGWSCHQGQEGEVLECPGPRWSGCPPGEVRSQRSIAKTKLWFGSHSFSPVTFSQHPNILKSKLASWLRFPVARTLWSFVTLGTDYKGVDGNSRGLFLFCHHCVSFIRRVINLYGSCSLLSTCKQDGSLSRLPSLFVDQRF